MHFSSSPCHATTLAQRISRIRHRGGEPTSTCDKNGHARQSPRGAARVASTKLASRLLSQRRFNQPSPLLATNLQRPALGHSWFARVAPWRRVLALPDVHALTDNCLLPPYRTKCAC